MIKNNKGEAHIADLFFLLVIALSLGTFATAYFATAMFGQNIGAMSFGIDNPTFSSNQNFTTCSYNQTVWLTTKWSTWSTNGCNNGASGSIGATLQAVTGNINGYLFVNNEGLDSDGNVVNTYVINNSVQQPYIILLRGTGSDDQNEIDVTSTGFSIPQFSILSSYLLGMIQTGTDFNFNYPNADNIVNPTIQTVYNDNTPSVTFYFNGVAEFTTSQLNSNGWNPLGMFTHYYAGVGSNTPGFTLTSFNTNNQIFVTSQNLMSGVTSFVTNILNVLDYGIPNSYDPYGISNEILRIEEIGLFICMIVLIASVV